MLPCVGETLVASLCGRGPPSSGGVGIDVLEDDARKEQLADINLHTLPIQVAVVIVIVGWRLEGATIHNCALGKHPACQLACCGAQAKVIAQPQLQVHHMDTPM
jgi:hypothetical protein